MDTPPGSEDGRRAGGRGGRGGGGRGRRGRASDRVEALSGPLASVLERLPETQRAVIELRMGLKDGHPHDIGDTAQVLGLSRSEAREIEARAFAHIREVIPLDRLEKLLRS